MTAARLHLVWAGVWSLDAIAGGIIAGCELVQHDWVGAGCFAIAAVCAQYFAANDVVAAVFNAMRGEARATQSVAGHARLPAAGLPEESRP